jgi:hypothetical protein
MIGSGGMLESGAELELTAAFSFVLPLILVRLVPALKRWKHGESYPSFVSYAGLSAGVLVSEIGTETGVWFGDDPRLEGGPRRGRPCDHEGPSLLASRPRQMLDRLSLGCACRPDRSVGETRSCSLRP